MTRLEKQLASVGKQLGSSLDQLDLDKRLSAVEKTLGGVADKVGLAERRSVLGVPVSRKRPEWGKIATYGAAAVGVVVVGARALGGSGDAKGSGSAEQAEITKDTRNADREDKHAAKDWKEEGDG